MKIEEDDEEKIKARKSKIKYYLIFKNSAKRN
jgi:hypothetical protein